MVALELDLFDKLERNNYLMGGPPMQYDTALSPRIASYHDRFPWMDAGAVWSLSSSGIDVSSPTAAAAASAAANVKTRDGFGFDTPGSPATGGAIPGALDSVFAKLDRAPAANVVPDARRYAAQSSPLQEMMGDAWKQLPDDVKRSLSTLTFKQVGYTQRSSDPTINPKRTKDQSAYEIVGFDALPDNAKQAFLGYLHDSFPKDVRPGLTGSAQTLDDQLHFDGRRTAIDSVYSGPATVTFSQAIPSTEGSPFDIVAEGIPAIAPPLRIGTMALSAPIQELQGQIRNLHELVYDHTNPNWLQSQSDLGIAAGDVLTGRRVDTGTGIFVDQNSEVVRERQRRETQRGLINGHGITIGRWVADQLPDSYFGYRVLDPNGKGYQALSGLVDATTAIKADPAAKIMKETSLASKASKEFTDPGSVTQAINAFRETGELRPALTAFHDAGGITGLRPMVSQDAVNAWRSSPEQMPLWNRIAEQPDTYTIWRGLNRKVDLNIAARLADETDPAKIPDILGDQLGVVIRQKPTMKDFGFGLPGQSSIPPPGVLDQPLVFRAQPPSRWTAMMPSGHVAADDLAQNALELERASALMKLPEDQFRPLFDRMARTTDPFERLGVWEDTMHTMIEHLVGKGIATDRAMRLTRLWQEAESIEKVYSQDQIGKGLGAWDTEAVINGEATTLKSSPHTLAQHINGYIPLPDWRAMRKALSTARPFLENKGVLGAEHLVTAGQQKIWKSLQISSVKTMIKVLGDDQAKMAALGYDSLFNHPLSTLSMVAASPLAELPEDAGFLSRLTHAASGGARAVIDKLPGVEPSFTKTITGDDFEHLWELQQVASHGANTLAEDSLGVIAANHWEQVYKTDQNMDEFVKAWAGDIAQHASSPDMRGIAKAETLTDAQQWFWNGEGKQYRMLLAKAGREGHADLLNRDGSDRWVNLSMQQLQAKTNGNPDLLDAIAHGDLTGTPIWVAGEDGTPSTSAAFVRKLTGYTDDAPMVTRQASKIYSADLAQRKLGDAFFRRALSMLLETPSATLSKSPFFRQAYWRRIIDNAPYMTNDAQAEALRIAQEEANLPDALVKQLSGTISRGNKSRNAGGPWLDLEQADTIAKGHALDQVADMTDEFVNRSQLFDSLRLLSPFGEVWRKTILRYSKIVAEQPQTIRRAQQVWEAAHGKDLGDFVGAPSGQGWFHKDSFGQEVFTIPGSEFATQAIAGAPVPLVGNVQGLSLGTDVFPGVGPVASIPVAWTLAKLHASPDIQNIIFPYGPPKDLSDTVAYMPGWFQRVFFHDRATSPDSVRTFDNSVIDMIRYGVTNGDYNLSTSEGVSAAMDDAEKKAHLLQVIRGGAAFFVPGSPSPQAIVRGKDGQILDAAALIEEYHRLQTDDPTTASQIFLNKYGPDIFSVTTPKSYAYVFGIPTSQASAQWVTDHPDVKRGMPHVYGYFAPPSDPKDFDYQVYTDQLKAGQGRAPLSPEQWTKIYNGRLAAMQYGRLRDVVDQATGGKPNQQARAALAAFKTQLIKEYPGYADTLYGGVGVPARPDAKLLVQELQTALDNPDVQNTDAGQGLAQYMTIRNAVDAAWQNQGNAAGTWGAGTSPQAVAIRAVLRQAGIGIERSHKQFGPLFDNVFELEMVDDTDLLGGRSPFGGN